MGIWKSAAFKSYPRNWLQKVKGAAMAPRRKEWSSGPGGGSSSETAKGPALREEVRLPVTSPKDPVSRPVPPSPEPEQRPQLAEAELVLSFLFSGYKPCCLTMAMWSLYAFIEKIWLE